MGKRVRVFVYWWGYRQEGLSSHFSKLPRTFLAMIWDLDTSWETCSHCVTGGWYGLYGELIRDCNRLSGSRRLVSGFQVGSRNDRVLSCIFEDRRGVEAISVMNVHETGPGRIEMHVDKLLSACWRLIVNPYPLRRLQNNSDTKSFRDHIVKVTVNIYFNSSVSFLSVWL